MRAVMPVAVVTTPTLLLLHSLLMLLSALAPWWSRSSAGIALSHSSTCTPHATATTTTATVTTWNCLFAWFYVLNIFVASTSTKKKIQDNLRRVVKQMWNSSSCREMWYHFAKYNIVFLSYQSCSNQIRAFVLLCADSQAPKLLVRTNIYKERKWIINR